MKSRNEALGIILPEDEKVLDIKVAELDISVRACNTMRRAGHETVRDLLYDFKSKDEILKVSFFGINCGKEIARELQKLGISSEVWETFS